MPQQPAVMCNVHGRDREWAQLVEALTRAERGSPRLLIIEGSRGSGRTRMLHELAAAAKHEGRLVLAHQGWRPAPAVAHLTAELTQLVGQVDADVVPFVVAWDDPPWPHAAFTIALERTMLAAPIFWVLTRRIESVFGTPAPAHGVCVDLPPVCAAATARIAADLLGATPSSEVLALTAVAGGNPGALTELITGMLDEGIIQVVRTGTAGATTKVVAAALPRRTHAVLRHAMAALSPEARHLVQVAAVVGRASRLDDLAQLLDTTPVALMPSVAEAMSANLFLRDTEQVVFSHDLVWRLVADSVPRAVLRPVQDAIARLGAGERVDSRAAIRLQLLTPAEREVARLVGQGMPNKQVARALHVSHHTVNYHLRQIYRKLDVTGRVELARLTWPDPPAVA